MRTRSNNPFSTVTTSGLLLPIDLLARVADGDPDLKGLQGKDYHLRSGERLNESAARAWSQCLSAWKSFRKRFGGLPESDFGTTTTRDEWLLPLFQELGYGRLQTKKALDFDGTEYPITHGWEDHVPIHLLSARLPLDRRTPGISGAAARAPYSLMQELLNRSAAHRWGFVTNGLKLYLLRDNAALARAANVEFDLEAMMDGEVYADFFLLFCLCHQSRVEIRGTGEETDTPNPEDCWLEDWANQADQQGTRAREKLRDGVEASIQSLGAGFLTTRGNEALRARLSSGELSTQDFYRQLLRLVYRLLMLLVAEEKRSESGDNLLHPPGTTPEIRDRYARFYGVGRVRALAYERRGTAHTDLYESLKVLFLKLRTGYEPLGIPGMGSFLFSDDSTPDLDDAFMANQDLLDAFRNLCYTDDTSARGGGIRRPVDFGNLGSEELGSVYESLLELHPLIDTDDGPFTLGTAAGHERKTTGSYYTPTSLINCLLDSALDPVVHEAIDVPDAAEAERKLLDLKVCDPACGSGHFLIAAADRMAMHLARIRTGDDQPNTIDIQHAKRDIIGRCIYGVDMNPMAVELCKVSLWMEALEPGKPLSFLDHHIQCGNSLIGATPKLLAEGIPDDAFKPIEGDDKEVCKELKKRNKREREDYKNKQGYLFEPVIMLGNLTGEFAKLTAAEDDSLESIAAKRKKYAELVKGTSYQNARMWADTWCAAFVWKKDDSDLGRLCPTERKFRDIERSPFSINLAVKSHVQNFSNKYQFFHWHLAFPEVFELQADSVQSENVGAGWSGGFSAVLGNPPWEHTELKEQEWFADRSPKIAAASGAKRKKLINSLESEDPKLFREFVDASRTHESWSHFIRGSTRYPLCARGRTNTYGIFAELNLSLTQRHGRLGCIVPTGIATDDTYKYFFQALVDSNRLVSLYDFENRDAIFPGVHRSYKFCLLTTAGVDGISGESNFVFFASSISDVSDNRYRFQLNAFDIALLNPNSRTCPVFRSAADAELSKHLFRRNVILVHDDACKKNDDEVWLVAFKQGLYNMTSDSALFTSLEALEKDGEVKDDFGRLYEGRLGHQFNHRFATQSGTEIAELDLSQLSDPNFLVSTQYLVATSETEQRLARREKQCDSALLGFRRVSRSTDERTSIATMLPWGAASYGWILTFGPQPSELALLLAAYNSFPLDYCLRNALSQPSIPVGTFEQLVVPSRSSVLGQRSVILPRVLELIYCAWDLEVFAKDCEYDGPPLRWHEERRFNIRCELDAAYFHLYLGSEAEWGADNPTLLAMFPTPRHAVDYIMDTFPIVRRKDEAKYDGEYRTKTTILRIYDEMAEAIRTGVPYQTSLNPPPGPPTDTQGNFIPFADWTDEIRAAYKDVIHLDSVEPNDKQDAKRKQGEAILYLRLLLKERGKPVQREVFQLDLCFALNRDLRRRILSSEPISDAERLAEAPTEVLPQLRQQLEALKQNEVIDLTMIGNRQVIELFDESDLETPLCQSMLPMVREAIQATGIILGKRDDDDFSEEAMENLRPFLKEGELENSITL